MSEVSVAYTLASHIHEAFFDSNEIISDIDRENSGVITRTGMLASKTTQRVELHGDVNGRPAWQTLAKDKNGNFHLSTTYSEYGGEHVQTKLFPNSPVEDISALMDTVFMKKLVEIALRQSHKSSKFVH